MKPKTLCGWKEGSTAVTLLSMKKISLKASCGSQASCITMTAISTGSVAEGETCPRVNSKGY